MWLGHHSPALTLSTYFHLLSEDLPAIEFFASAEEDRGAADRRLSPALAT
jgi:hypothetical protein